MENQKRQRNKRRRNRKPKSKLDQTIVTNGYEKCNNDCRGNPCEINNKPSSPRPQCLNQNDELFEIKRCSGSEYEDFRTPSVEYEPQKELVNGMETNSFSDPEKLKSKSLDSSLEKVPEIEQGFTPSTCDHVDNGNFEETAYQCDKMITIEDMDLNPFIECNGDIIEISIFTKQEVNHELADNNVDIETEAESFVPEVENVEIEESKAEIIEEAKDAVPNNEENSINVCLDSIAKVFDEFDDILLSCTDENLEDETLHYRNIRLEVIEKYVKQTTQLSIKIPDEPCKISVNSITNVTSISGRSETDLEKADNKSISSLKSNNEKLENNHRSIGKKFNSFIKKFKKQKSPEPNNSNKKSSFEDNKSSSVGQNSPKSFTEVETSEDFKSVCVLQEINKTEDAGKVDEKVEQREISLEKEIENEKDCCLVGKSETIETDIQEMKKEPLSEKLDETIVTPVSDSESQKPTKELKSKKNFLTLLPRKLPQYIFKSRHSRSLSRHRKSESPEKKPEPESNKFAQDESPSKMPVFIHFDKVLDSFNDEKDIDPNVDVSIANRVICKDNSYIPNEKYEKPEKKTKIRYRNDDHLFPDAVTPTKVVTFDPPETYDVPFIDDPAVYDPDELYLGENRKLIVNTLYWVPRASTETLFTPDDGGKKKKSANPLTISGKRSISTFIGTLVRSR